MSLKAHGGAVRYWVHEGGSRAVLCTDGAVMRLKASRWREWPGMTPDLIDSNKGWRTDTRPSLSGAITRTNREARRGV